MSVAGNFFPSMLKTCRSFRFIHKSVSCLQFALGHSFRTRDNWGLSREWQENGSQRKDEDSCHVFSSCWELNV